MTFNDIFKKQKDLENGKYPKGKNEAPIYVKTPIFDCEFDVIAYVEQLTCPVCQKLVKKSDNFCEECGNKLKNEEV